MPKELHVPQNHISFVLTHWTAYCNKIHDLRLKGVPNEDLFNCCLVEAHQLWANLAKIFPEVKDNIHRCRIVIPNPLSVIIVIQDEMVPATSADLIEKAVADTVAATGSDDGSQPRG